MGRLMTKRDTHAVLYRMTLTSTSRLKYLRERYGELLTLEDVAEIFRYKTVAAVRKAHSRKTLPIKLYRFSGRAGYLARVEDVADCIEKMSSS